MRTERQTRVWNRSTPHACLAVCLLWLGLATAHPAPPLTTLHYDILGRQLRVTPAVVSVPKGVPGSVLVQFTAADGTTNNVDASVGNGGYIEAILRGPAFPARRLVGRPGEALMLPPINLSGDYQLDGIRLIDSTTGETRFEAIPSSVPVHVFDQVLVSTVTSRPLTMQEIADRGIVIDANNFRAVEFEAAFVLDGRTIHVKLPVVAPDFRQSTELIPNDEMNSRLTQARLVNDQLAQQAIERGSIPPELQRPGLNIQIKGANFQLAEGEVRGLNLAIPPIPALLVIPGNIGYLNQFFSVQIFTENASPLGSGLSVFNVTAKLKLPTGPDGILSTNYSAPGDDPLRFARVGPQTEVHDTLQLFGPSPEKTGRLYPGRSGTGEFLVEGLQEGLHVLDLELNASLDGLAAGTVQITGKAAGSVLVRNPKFSLAFSHPKTVRSFEPYTAYVTVLNTGSSDANLVSVSLRGASISGGVLESAERVDLGNIAPGQSATASFRIKPQRTGSVKFSNLTTGEASVLGQFNLTMGIDERGVELSPDTIGLPDLVGYLPSSVVDAANRVLGQALSAATAPLLPVGVKPVSRWTITRRVLELAEAGQRIKYLEPTNRVLVDLILDWQGGRAANDIAKQQLRTATESLVEASRAPVVDDGFDQILRTTEAGRQFRSAILQAAENKDELDATTRLVDRAADVAGRGESWLLASSSDPGLQAEATGQNGAATNERSDLPEAVVYSAQRGSWVVIHDSAYALRWSALSNVSSAELAVVALGTNGVGQRWRWTVQNVSAGSCFSFNPALPIAELMRDENCDGSPEGAQFATAEAVHELPPSVITVVQDTDVVLSRPYPACTAGPAKNYGHVLGVLFSKPMVQTNAARPTAYQVDNGSYASHIQMQPGGRIALVSIREGVSEIRPRHLTVNGVTDERGNAVEPSPQSILTDFRDGVAVRGRVLRADGSPAAGVPVTVTMYDQIRTPSSCDPVTTRIAQKYTDANGLFSFDFVLAGVPFTIAAVDTGGLTREAIDTIMDSSVGDRFAAEKLAALAAATNALSKLGVDNMAQATRLIEGLDRAVWSDTVEYQGGRMGQEITVGLRFRGRAVVSGMVMQPDGVTPVPNAAVNLFPDTESRELGRGMFTGKDGRFEFNGVPLGRFTVSVQTDQRNFRTIAGNLTQVGTTNDYVIVLTQPVQSEIVRSAISGRVVEPDGVTGHGQGRVFVSVDGYGVLAAPTADNNGYWQVNDIPIGLATVEAFSQDGRRRAIGRGGVVTNAVSFVLTALTGTGSVVGRVETSAGLPVSNAIVAGGLSLVRTDADGFFRLTGVPQGSTKISAGLEATNCPCGFPRLANANVNVLPDVDNFVVVRFAAFGQITGSVKDANGNPVTGQNVAVPLSHGFAWVKLDAAGRFRFPNMAVRDYIVSAPAPPVDADAEEILDAASGGTDDQIAAALQEAVIAANQVALRRLGETPTASPGSFGWTTASIRFDGETVDVDIRYLPEGKVSGRVLNDRGVPIGAAVRLTGPGLDGIGNPATVTLGNQTSEPALGTFSFARLPQGDWAMQASSPFYRSVLVTNGVTVPDQLDVTNAVLQFPPINDFSGRVVGQVLMPDGLPAGSGVKVKINFAADYEIVTDTNGVFDTQVNLPARNYTVEAEDETNGLRGTASVVVKAGITNSVTVQLIGKGALLLTVLHADGTPATNATVRAAMASYPWDVYSETTLTNGQYFLQNAFAGQYGLAVKLVTGAGVLNGQTGIRVQTETTNSVTLTLGPSGTIRGVFRKRDDGSPVVGARINVGSTAVATTDATGAFEVSGLPLGAYKIVAREPVSGRAALSFATLAVHGQSVNVTLLELPQGELRGMVFQSGETRPIPGASVILSQDQSLGPSVTITTGPDGAFSFPAAIPGAFTLSASKVYPPSEIYSHIVTGNYPDNATSMSTDIILPARTEYGRVIVQVYEPGGSIPATNASVNGFSTDANGQVVFDNLPLGLQIFRAHSARPGHTSSAGRTNVILTTFQTILTNSITLSGVGRVHGRVLQGDGTTPAIGAQVKAEGFRADFGVSRNVQALTGTNGEFVFEDFPLAPVRVSAVLGPLASSGSAIFTNAGQTVDMVLRLGGSGSVTGRLVRADGVTPVVSASVSLTFAAPSGLDGIASAFTDNEGGFHFDTIPVGEIKLTAVQPEINGLAKLKNQVGTNGQLLDLGDVLLHEAWPEVTSITPVTGAQSVSTATHVEITFSEPIATNTILASGIYLRGLSNVVPCNLTWDAPTNADGGTLAVRLIPKAPLQGQVVHRVYVLAGTVTDGLNNIIGRGPSSLVDRPLLAPFSSSFNTRDDLPPRLVSVFPTNNSQQIDPAAVMRLSFNEPLSQENLSVVLNGPQGSVAGFVTLLFNGTVLSFTPAQFLGINGIYTLSVNGIRDLAGNAMVGQPLSIAFNTLDTLGPTINRLQMADGQNPVAGAPARLEALLATTEPGAAVRFTANLIPIGTVANPPFRLPITLPFSGSITYRATATDRYGNDGPFTNLTVTVLSNEPPAIILLRGTPTNEVLGSGQAFTVIADATDDVFVTNIALNVSGALIALTNVSGGSSNLVQFRVPAGAVAGTPLSVQAQAADFRGMTSSVATLNYVVVDSTSPTLSILSPTNNAVVNPAGLLEIVVAATDNSTNLQLELTVGAPLGHTQTINVASSPGQTVTNQFSVTLAGAPPNGGPLTVTVRAVDDAGNFATATRMLILPDLQPPRLVSVSPPNGAVRQSLWLTVVNFTFDEPLGNTTVSTNTVQFTNSAGVIWPYRVVNLVQVQPLVRPLLPGVTYVSILSPALSDEDGHRWVDQNGNAPPALGAAFTFTTAAIFDTAPTNNTPVIAGQTVPVAVAFEPGLGATSFQFILDSNSPVAVNVTANASNATAVLTLSTNATSGTIHIAARRPGEPPYLFPDVSLDVRPFSGDEDGDGLSNGYEIANQLNPFVNDASLDPDTDGLTNLQEFQRGTNPHLWDTDGDDLSDGEEVARGGCLDPLNRDSDDDGLLDGADPNPCAAGVGLVIQAPSEITILEGASTNIIVRAISDEAEVTVLEFAIANPPPLFARLTEFNFSGFMTNGSATATLALSPTFDAAGVYTLTLHAMAKNGAESITNITVTVVDNGALLVTRWLGGTNGNWSAATRWSQGVPDASKVAVIDVPGNYQVTIDVDTTVAGMVVGGVPGAQTVLNSTRILTLNGTSEVRSNGVLRFSGGTIQGPGQLTIGGQMDWLASGMSGSGQTIISGAGKLNATGAGTKSLGRELENYGTIVLSNGMVTFVNGRILNRPGATVLAQSLTLQLSGTTASFTNQGTFVITGTNVVSFSGVPFYNFGTVTLTNGTLSLNGGGLHTTTLNVSTGATLNLNGVFSTTAGSVLEGAGRIRFNGGTHTFGGDFLPTSPVTFGSGTITLSNTLPITVITNVGASISFNAPQELDVCVLQGGALTGTADLRLSGQMFWTGGTLAGTGRLIIASNAVLQASGSTSKNLNRYVENNGTLTLAGPLTLDVTGGGIVNRPGATVLAQGVTVQAGFSSPFTNQGAFVVTGSNAVGFVNVPFYNFGTVTLTNGTLSLNSGGLHTTALNVSTGATLNLNGVFSTTAGSVLGGAGKIQFALGGTYTFGGDFLPTAPVTFGAGTITISNTLPTTAMTNIGATVNFNALQQFDVCALQGGIVTGTGDLTVKEQMFWTGGTLAGTGRLIIASNAVLQASGSIAKNLNRDLENNGTLALMGPYVLTVNGGGILNRPGAVVLADGVNFQSGGSNSFTNQGAFVLVGTNSVSFGGLNWFYNSGAVTLTNGTLTFFSRLTNSGSMTITGAARLILPAGMRLEPGTVFSGDGTVQLQNAMQLATNVNFGRLNVVFENNASISGLFALANDVGGTMTFNRNLTLPTALTIAGTMTVGASNITVTINGTLTLEAGATLNNPGTVLVAGFIDHGGTINGNPPLLLAPALAPLRIELIQLKDLADGGDGPNGRAAGTNRAVLLKWSAAPMDRFVVESTPDLRTWTDLPVVVTESAPGTFEATLTTGRNSATFYRLRRF